MYIVTINKFVVSGLKQLDQLQLLTLSDCSITFSITHLVAPKYKPIAMHFLTDCEQPILFIVVTGVYLDLQSSQVCIY